MRQLTPFDAQFLAIEKGNLTCHYCGLAIFDAHPQRGPLTVEQVRAHIGSRIDRIPPLRWHLKAAPLGIDHPRWVDGPVDIADHVVATTLPAPGGERELAKAAGDVLATPLDRSRPLWRLDVIDGLADGRVAVGITFHHASADALAASAVMGLLMDLEPGDGRELPEAAAPLAVPGPVRTVARAAKQPLSAAKAAASALPHLDQVPMMRTLPGARAISGAARTAKRAAGFDVADPGGFPVAPVVRWNGPLSAGRSVAWATVPVDTVRTIKSHHEVSFNDVVVAAVGGGLRRRLLAGDELPEDPLLAFVPVNIRAEGENPTSGNLISSFVVPVPTNEPDAAARIRAAHDGMAAAKALGKTTPQTLMRDANAIIPPAVFPIMAGGMLALLGSGRIAAPLNLTISNVPGPPQRLHLAGAPATVIAPLSLIFGGVALNVTVVSYAGELQIGVVGDAELVPDAWELVADIEAEFAELLHAQRAERLA